jgi:hypothetical protein
VRPQKIVTEDGHSERTFPQCQRDIDHFIDLCRKLYHFELHTPLPTTWYRRVNLDATWQGSGEAQLHACKGCIRQNDHASVRFVQVRPATELDFKECKELNIARGRRAALGGGHVHAALFGAARRQNAERRVSTRDHRELALGHLACYTAGRQRSRRHEDRIGRVFSPVRPRVPRPSHVRVVAVDLAIRHLTRVRTYSDQQANL